MANIFASLCSRTHLWAQENTDRIRDAAGQTMVEYVMLIVLVALAVFLLTPNIKSAILTVFSNTSSALK